MDKEAFEAFALEAQSYIPSIREGLASAGSGDGAADSLKDARSKLHLIKGASAMIGLAGVSHIAYCAEDILTDILDGSCAAEAASSFLNDALSRMAALLDSNATPDPGGREAARTTIIAYRRLKNLPPEDDEAALADFFDAAGTAVPEPAAGRLGLSEAEDDEVSLDEIDVDEDGDEGAAPAGEKHTDAVPAEVLEVFRLESEDHLQNISTLLGNLQNDPDQKDVIQNLRRVVHTLKGSAGAVGFLSLSTMAHRMEDLLDAMTEGYLALSEEMLNLLFASSDALEDIAQGRQEEDSLRALHETYDGFLSTYSARQPAMHAEADVKEEDGREEISEPEPVPTGQARPEPGHAAAPAAPGDYVRVPFERIDDLVKMVGELIITRTVFEQHMTEFAERIDEMKPAVDRMKAGTVALESRYEVSTLSTGMLQAVGGDDAGYGFDDLEFDRYTEFHRISRDLSEATSDIGMVNNELVNLSSDFESLMHRQARISSEIQEKLMRMRMMPLATLSARLQRTVRVVAQSQGKQADLIIMGEDIELDKKMLDEMADPLMHIMRNAVDHGIETPELRRAKGKPERGIIRLHAYHEGNQVVIAVSDDGKGLSAQSIRTKAVNSGLVTGAEAAELPDSSVYELIFEPGFSTAETVTEVSGRGVGMDVVKTNVGRLQGTIATETTPGEGSAFTIRLPMTLAIMQALLVRTHGDLYALPLAAVKELVRLDRDRIDTVGQREVVLLNDTAYPLVRLGTVLNRPQTADEQSRYAPVLVLDTGPEQVALLVDEIVGGREIVIKNLGTHLRRVHCVSGATLMGDGQVVLILNPHEIVSRGRSLGAGHEHARHPAQQPGELTVMIVDDSVSIRHVVSNLVRSAGWKPLTAKDGMDALEKLQQSYRKPSIVLLDVEMPRMDGYELLATLKANEVYRKIPVVMVTSRSGSKHRIKALEMGAAEYVIKPYQDETLKNLIRHLALQPKV